MNSIAANEPTTSSHRLELERGLTMATNRATAFSNLLPNKVR